VFPIHLPPLRDRKDDIVPIAQKLLLRHCDTRRPCPVLAESAGKLLMVYEWPGNIRELDNVMQRALVLSDADIQQEHILIDATSLWRDQAVDSLEEEELPESQMVLQDLKQQEIELIVKTLQSQNGNKGKTAEVLQMSPRTLRYKLAKLREVGYDV
jgi:two-component system response regulator FlrC